MRLAAPVCVEVKHLTWKHVAHLRHHTGQTSSEGASQNQPPKPTISFFAFHGKIRNKWLGYISCWGICDISDTVTLWYQTYLYRPP